MSSRRTSMRCLWNGCPSPDAYSTDRALFEHLSAEHGGGPELSAASPFACHWAGCAYSSAEPYERTLHLSRHTQYRPHICTRAGCGKAYFKWSGLCAHRRVHTALAHRAEEDCRCAWAGCGVRHACPRELRDHLEHHAAGLKRGRRCEWEGCDYRYTGGGYRLHLWTHLPYWYRPFMCSFCNCTFQTPAGLANHTRVMHPVPDGTSGAKHSGSEVVDHAAPTTATRKRASPASPAPKIMLRLKRPRKMEPHSPEDSESELDIVLNTPKDFPDVKLECEQAYDAEIAIAVARIVDSPVWALSGRRPATKMAARAEGLQNLDVDDETDWVYCT